MLIRRYHVLLELMHELRQDLVQMRLVFIELPKHSVSQLRTIIHKIRQCNKYGVLAIIDGQLSLTFILRHSILFP